MFRTRHTRRQCSVLLLVACTLTAAPALFAQDPKQGVMLGAHLMMGFPQGEFEREFKSVSFGLGLDLGYAIQPLPVTAGLGGSYATYGEKTFTATFTDALGTYHGEATSTNSIVLVNPFVRFQPNHGWFRPYFEFTAGLSFFNTSTSFKDLATDTEIGGETESLSVGFTYGAGGGIAFWVYSGKVNDDDSKAFQIYVDARLRYLGGSSVKYYLEDAMYLDEDTGKIKFDPSKQRSSTVDMIIPYLGVMVRVQ